MNNENKMIKPSKLNLVTWGYYNIDYLLQYGEGPGIHDEVINLVISRKAVDDIITGCLLSDFNKACLLIDECLRNEERFKGVTHLDFLLCNALNDKNVQEEFKARRVPFYTVKRDHFVKNIQQNGAKVYYNLRENCKYKHSIKLGPEVYREMFRDKWNEYNGHTSVLPNGGWVLSTGFF